VNRLALGKARIAYPDFNHHLALGNWYSRGRSESKRSPFYTMKPDAKLGPALSEYLAARAAAAPAAASPNEPSGAGRLLVLSSEGLSGLSEEELAALRADLAPHCGSIEFLLYAKHPLDYAPSFAQTQIKNGVKSIAQIIEQPPRFAYGRALTEASKVFGRAHVHVRDSAKESLVSGDVVEDFFSLLGEWGWASPALKRPDFPPNPSLNVNAVRAADYLLQLRGAAFLQRMATRRLLQSSMGPVFALPEHLVPAIAAASAADLQFLEAEYGLKLKASAKPRFMAIDFAAPLKPEIKERLDRFSANQP
jgi:hypothetical protein